MIQQLNKNLEKVLAKAQRTEKKDLTEIRQRIRNLEESTKENTEVAEEDLGTVVDELERQEKEIEDIREGYEELGEMMQLVLDELRDTTRKYSN
jgi:molecular chaperone GrpE (heat shock protein)